MGGLLSSAAVMWGAWLGVGADGVGAFGAAEVVAGDSGDGTSDGVCVSVV